MRINGMAVKGCEMSGPYNNDTKESYFGRMKETFLDIAERHHDLGHERAMWLHLFNWVRCEEIYGGHWDDLKTRGQA
jgi:hypothetical protein